jgi:hypothetical protein
MQRFTVHTLIDITETKMFKHQNGSDMAKNQQQNFITLLQTIGLRVNPSFTRSPVCEEQDLKAWHFGSEYKGNHNVWTFDFEIEYDGAFADQFDNQTGLLVQDLHFVPVISQLTETVTLKLAVFDTTSSDYCNTVVYTGA